MQVYDLTLRKLAEKLDRKIGATLSRDESKLDIPYLYALLNEARADMAQQMYQKMRRWSSAYFQTYQAEYEPDLQEDTCFTIFRIPQYIQADAARDGIVYIGAKNGKKKYVRVNNPAQLNEYLNHPMLSKDPLVLTEGGDYCRVYSATDTNIRELEVVGVQADPMQLDHYNPDYDPYPMPRDIETEILNAAVNALNPAIFTAQDKLSDGADSSRMTK